MESGAIDSLCSMSVDDIYFLSRRNVCGGVISAIFFKNKTKQNLLILTHDGNIDAFHNFEARSTDTHNIVLDTMPEILRGQE